MSLTHINVRGARQHNLRDVSVSIPRNTLTVVTGLSGSGKSSLAFDTIYAEGQRRYVETLSAYARQFLDQMERPDVDSIDGLYFDRTKDNLTLTALHRRHHHRDLRLPAAAVRLGRPTALPQLPSPDLEAVGGPDRRADRGAQPRGFAGRAHYDPRSGGARTQG